MTAAAKTKPKPKQAQNPEPKAEPAKVEVKAPEPPKVEHPPADDKKRWPCWYVNDEGETELFHHPDEVTDGYFRR